MKKITYLLCILLQLWTASVWADKFTVNSIRVEGLQNISAATVESYLTVKRGQTFNTAQSGQMIRSLYQTGFFDRITLTRSGNTLVVHVVERPIIGDLNVTGNSVVPTDKLNSVLKSMEVMEGSVYNPVIVDKIRQSLLSQYYMLGRYNARVEVNTAPLPHHRITLSIIISEGVVAKVKRIAVIGNTVFSERQIIRQLDLSTTGIISWFTQSDRFSEDKLQASIDKIRSFYMDHGYLRVQVTTSQAQITPNRKAVYITFIIKEGVPYTVKSVDLQGDLILPRADYDKFVTIKPGDTFNRQQVMKTQKDITDFLGSQGYMLASVSIRPEVNDTLHNVVLVFDVQPGKRVYIRHITFSDNNRTNDVVLRREMQQMEAAPASTVALNESKHRLSLLPYIKDVTMSVQPVPDANNQVDVNYQVKEDSSAQATFKVGYSQDYGTIIGAGVNQKNFFGTGNTLGINFSQSHYQQFYGIDYTNPYYTEDGISRSFNFALSKVDPAGAGLNNGYTTNEFDLGVMYGIPIGQQKNVYSNIQTGIMYQNTLVNLSSSGIPNQVLDFVSRHGRRFQEADIKLGFSRDSRDKAIFPTSGNLQTIVADGYAPLDSSSLSYYMLNYAGKWYFPLSDQFIVISRANLGYGNGFHGINDFPFFKNYYAGGIDSIRGYDGFSLGPKDSNGNPFGGNMLLDASIGLIFPNYLTDNLRTSAFIDGGNVYSSKNNRSFGGNGTGGNSTNSGPPRYSLGVEADWITPLGPIEIAVSKPLNKRPGDNEDIFQFALGANF